MRRRDVVAGLGLAALAGRAWAQPAAAPVRVEMVTGAGRLVLELAVDKAPITAANFLKYVELKLYDGSKIYRAMKMQAAPPQGLVQGGARFDPAKAPKPIAHEPTTQTGLRHGDGTISLARREPGTATSDFFICVGDNSYLDADPAASGDNLGFAAFGRVAEGMDVARAMLLLPVSATEGPPGMVGQMLSPPIPIVSAKRLG